MACCNIMSMLIKVFCHFQIFSIIWRRRYIHVNNNISKGASLTLMDSNSSSRYQWKLSSNSSTITYFCFSVLCKFWYPCIINSITIIVLVFLTVKLSNQFIFKLNPECTWYNSIFAVSVINVFHCTHSPIYKTINS